MAPPLSQEPQPPGRRNPAILPTFCPRSWTGAARAQLWWPVWVIGSDLGKECRPGTHVHTCAHVHTYTQSCFPCTLSSLSLPRANSDTSAAPPALRAAVRGFPVNSSSPPPPFNPQQLPPPAFPWPSLGAHPVGEQEGKVHGSGLRWTHRPQPCLPTVLCYLGVMETDRLSHLSVVLFLFF